VPIHRPLEIGIACVLALVPGPLRADSDGYFCATTRYLAYDFGLSGYGAHELRVVSLTTPLGKDPMRTIRLPDFQVHGLICKQSEVLILGWDHLYTASLLPAPRPPGLHSESLPTGGYRPPAFSKGDGTRNLGSVARPQAIQLDGSRPGVFLITKVMPSGRDCESRIVSSLEEVDREGRARATLLLYDGVRGAECGE
jgi:hypothetical protein